MDNRLKHLNALHSFEVAARHQSYSRAAEELFVSQAAISQQMRHLEQVLSTKLFVRNGRNMILTQSGKQLFTACQKGFNTIIDGLNSIQCEGIPGELTITSTQAFCSMWIMPRLYKFSQLHSEISIKIMGSNQVEDLSKKHIDVAIRFSTVEGRYDNEQHVVEFIGKEIQTAYLESYSEYGQNIFDRYVTYADFWIQDQEYRDPETGDILDRQAINEELEKIEKPAGISNPKDFRNEIVNFVLRARANNNGKNPSWQSYEKLRAVIEKKMFSNTEDLLPVISFNPKSSKNDQKKHEDFVIRLVDRGYTEKQVRLLSEWYLRVRKSQ